MKHVVDSFWSLFCKFWIIKNTFAHSWCLFILSCFLFLLQSLGGADRDNSTIRWLFRGNIWKTKSVTTDDTKNESPSKYGKPALRPPLAVRGQEVSLLLSWSLSSSSLSGWWCQSLVSIKKWRLFSGESSKGAGSRRSWLLFLAVSHWEFRIKSDEWQVWFQNIKMQMTEMLLFYLSLQT